MIIRNRSARSRVKKAKIARGDISIENDEERKELKRYLSIIDDLQAKLFSPTKYPEALDDYSPSSDDIWGCLYEDYNYLWELYNYFDFDEYEKSRLWGLVNAHDWPEHLTREKLNELKGNIVSSYQSWVVWIHESDSSDRYLELVNSLHPSTLNSLLSIVPEFQSPKQIKEIQQIECLYDPESHSEHEITSFDEFVEFYPYEYQQFLKGQLAYHENVADIIRKHIEKKDKWPRAWMKNDKQIAKRLMQVRQFIPILNYITNHALHRTSTHNFPRYIRKDDDIKYLYIVAKINTGKIADNIGVSKDTVKRYIGAMKKVGFIKSLTNPYYAIGYWNKRNRVFFIKDTKRIREKLINFSIK